jgi:hypothetical protein
VKRRVEKRRSDATARKVEPLGSGIGYGGWTGGQGERAASSSSPRFPSPKIPKPVATFSSI